MKKTKTMRIAVLMLALSLLTCCFVGSTFAKYTSEATGSSTATVAKWSFTVEGKEIAVQPSTTFTFDLFSTINDTGNTADETDVADGKIAPGTAGSFELNVANTSEVNASYVITLTETNASNVPLQYSVNGTTWFDSMEALMADVTSANALKSDSIAMATGTAAHTVHWRWVFEGTTEGAHAGQTDVADTALGILGQDTAPTVTITASIVVNQND